MRVRFLAALMAIALLCVPASATAAPTQVPRVIGGSASSIDQSPWQVLIVMRGVSQCSGSLVSPTIVVTAAHCLAGFSASDLRVWTGITKTSDRSAAQESPVASAVAHPSFDSRTFANDIGVITLSKPVDLLGKARTIALPYGVDALTWPASGTPASVSGWGVTSPSGGVTSDQLMRADLQVLAGPGQPCGQYGPDLDPVQDICAGTPAGNIDACQGDSGGPLVTQGTVPFLTGLVSSGNECAKAGYPGLYSRVTTFLPWLTSQGSIPAAKPGMATNLTARNNGGRVTVSWSAPTEAGASGTIWKVTASPSGQSCVTMETACEFDSLPGGRVATFAVSGTNAFGEGSAVQLTAPFVSGLTSRKSGASITFAAITRLAGLSGKPAIKVTPASAGICMVRGSSVVMKQAGTCVIRLVKGKARHSLSVQVF